MHGGTVKTMINKIKLFCTNYLQILFNSDNNVKWRTPGKLCPKELMVPPKYNKNLYPQNPVIITDLARVLNYAFCIPGTVYLFSLGSIKPMNKGFKAE